MCWQVPKSHVPSSPNEKQQIRHNSPFWMKGWVVGHKSSPIFSNTTLTYFHIDWHEGTIPKRCWICHYILCLPWNSSVFFFFALVALVSGLFQCLLLIGNFLFWPKTFSLACTQFFMQSIVPQCHLLKLDFYSTHFLS